MKTKLFFWIFLFCLVISYGQTEQLKVDTKASKIKYKGDHLLHSWEGINKKVYGLAVYNIEDKIINKLAILVYVRDFDSKNSGRDAHSLEVLEALKYPEVRFYSEKIEIEENQLIITGNFNFHGIQVEKQLIAQLNFEEKKWELFGSFQLTPTDFNIDLPSFLSVKMEDLLEIEYHIVFKN